MNNCKEDVSSPFFQIKLNLEMPFKIFSLHKHINTTSLKQTMVIVWFIMQLTWRVQD